MALLCFVNNKLVFVLLMLFSLETYGHRYSYGVDCPEVKNIENNNSLPYIIIAIVIFVLLATIGILTWLLIKEKRRNSYAIKEKDIQVINENTVDNIANSFIRQVNDTNKLDVVCAMETIDADNKTRSYIDDTKPLTRLESGLDMNPKIKTTPVTSATPMKKYQMDEICKAVLKKGKRSESTSLADLEKIMNEPVPPHETLPQKMSNLKSTSTPVLDVYDDLPRAVPLHEYDQPLYDDVPKSARYKTNEEFDIVYDCPPANRNDQYLTDEIYDSPASNNVLMNDDRHLLPLSKNKKASVAYVNANEFSQFN